MNRFVSAVVLCCAFCATDARANKDWPEFRGPTGQGIATARNVPLEWSDTKNVAWKKAVPGKGWASPVLKNGRVYLTTAVEEGGAGSKRSLRALCFRESNGETLWDVEVFSIDSGKAPGVHNKNSHASPTPLVTEDRIYVHFGHQGTACLNLDGSVRWRNTLSYPPVHGSGGSPVLADDVLIFSADGASDPFVVALNKDTGKVVWKTKRDASARKKFSFSTPLLIEVKGRKQIISPGSGVVCALDPSNGRELWRVRYGEGYSIVPRPVFGHGLLFLSTGYDTPNLLAIRPGEKGDVTDSNVAWTIKRGAPNTPSPVLLGEELYFVSDAGIASCVDAKTGKLHWQERVGGNFSSSPVLAEGRIYFQNEEGTTTVVKASKQFEKLASNPLGERTLASPAIVDGAVILRTEGHLYLVQSK